MFELERIKYNIIVRRKIVYGGFMKKIGISTIEIILIIFILIILLFMYNLLEMILQN